MKCGGTTVADEVKRGRPPGEETPEVLIKRELIAHLKIYRKLRELVTTKIDKDGENMDAETLGKFMDLLRKGIVDMAKPIVAPAKADGAAKPDDEDPQKILDGLLSQKEERGR